MAAKLERYEEMRSLSARMVAAAQANDWDRLGELERRVGALRDELIAAGTLDEPTEGPEADRKRSLIQCILDDDAEIRRHTEPWMEHVREFLTGRKRQQKVCAAYAGGAGTPDAGAGSP